MRHDTISKCKKPTNATHHHRGKSSESLLDKDTILKELNILAGQTILDTGCGNGHMAKEFARLLNGTGRVYALDPDKEAIEILKKEAKVTNIEPLVADMTKTTPITSSFLALLYMSTIFYVFPKHQIPDFQKRVALKQIILLVAKNTIDI